MRTLSAGLLVELGLIVTRPGYLVQIDFSTPLYLSSLGDISWDGHTWAAADVKVAGLKSGQGGTISFGNALLDYGALVLNEGVADRGIKIYAVWAGVVEPVCEFDGVGDSSEVGDRVSISLSEQGSRSLYSPRRFINASTGFNTLLPAGTRLTLGQQTYILERR